MAKFDKVIPPGQTGLMEFNIDGKKVHGRFSKTVSVMTNDPKHRKISITLSGHITPYVQVVPASRIHLSGEYGQTVERELRVSSNEKDMTEPFKITGLRSTLDDKITYKAFPPNEAGVFLVKVWKNPKLTAGTHFGNLTIHTNSANMPDKTIQVQINTKSMMIVKPAVINFGTIREPIDKKDAHKQKSLVISNSKREFKIEDVTFNLDGYRAQIEPIKAGSSYKVTVDFYPKSGGQNFMGEMILHTNDPLDPKVRVRLISRLSSR